jgi:hypothetical protein
MVMTQTGEFQKKKKKKKKLKLNKRKLKLNKRKHFNWSHQRHSFPRGRDQKKGCHQ